MLSYLQYKLMMSHYRNNLNPVFLHMRKKFFAFLILFSLTNEKNFALYGRALYLVMFDSDYGIRIDSAMIPLSSGIRIRKPEKPWNRN